MTLRAKNMGSKPEPASTAVVTTVIRRIHGTIRLPANAKEEARAELPPDRAESLSMTGGIPSVPMQQAFRDLSRGLQDTDRGAEAGRTYNKLKR